MTTTNAITREQIESLLSRSEYVDHRVGVKTTVVCCILPNGYEIIESSGCVDAASYNHELGVATCKRRLVDQVWKLEGYRLQCQIHENTAKVPMSGDQAHG